VLGADGDAIRAWLAGDRAVADQPDGGVPQPDGDGADVEDGHAT
jgi:hypothetical protein